MGHLLIGLSGPSAIFYHKNKIPSLVSPRAVRSGAVRLGIALLFFVCAFVSNPAMALGVGAVESNSFIGERLEVRIPLFNVADPNSLEINFSSPQFGSAGQDQVNVSLDRSNSQLAVRLSSTQLMNEPYLNFTLGLVDAGTDFSKEFTVLLNLSPVSNVPVKSDTSSGESRALPEQSNYQVSSIAPAQPGSIMGPYETAQAGQIPERFGAVLDGQSLWRVARRINPAMGVSRSQMMWALYQANPNAFSGPSIESLKAGSYLTIPSADIVNRVSDQQAKQNMARLSSTSNKSLAADKSANETVDEEFALTAVDSSTSDPGEVAVESPFQVTGIDQGAEQSGEISGGSEKIISSLTETVGNLSQQLERKDRRIDFLEQQVAELKQYIDNGDPVETLNDDSSLVDQNSNIEALDSQESVNDLSTDVTSNANEVTSEVQATSFVSQLASIRIWQWGLFTIFLLSVVAYFARQRIVNLFRSLNLFGANDKVSFEQVDSPTEFDFDQTPSNQTSSNRASSNQTESNQVEEMVEPPLPSGKDFSIMEAVKHNMENGEALDGISYLDLADDGSYEPNDVLELVTEEDYEEASAEDLTFDERFEYLLDQKDFEFARELLDFARYNEIDDDRYHCERLRLLEKMKDEDGFYEYYYEIEAKIPTFPPALQTKISQLVVQLAHT